MKIPVPLSRVLGHTFVVGIGRRRRALDGRLLGGVTGGRPAGPPRRRWHRQQQRAERDGAPVPAALLRRARTQGGGRERVRSRRPCKVTRVASYVCASIVIEAMSLAVTAALLRQLPRVLGPVEWQRRGGWRGLTRQARRECAGIPRAHWAIFRRYLDRGFHPDDDDTTAILAERLDRLQHLRRWIEAGTPRGRAGASAVTSHEDGRAIRPRHGGRPER